MTEKFEGNLPPQEQEKGYPEDFKAKVKKVFPDWVELHKALDSGSELVGRYLDDSRRLEMRPKDIIEAFKSGNHDQVLKAAERADEIDKLYVEWLEFRQK